MFRLVESIRVREGQIHNLGYHQARATRSLRELYGYAGAFRLDELISRENIPPHGLFKCRICYSLEENVPVFSVEFVPYHVPVIRSLKVVTADDHFTYRHKYLNRRGIDDLYAQRASCDDVLIIKAGKVTDCSFSNVVFRRGAVWYTPDKPLLQGTMRQKLLDHERIVIADIGVEDLNSFETCKPINAMLGFDAPEIEVSRIVF